MRLVVGREAPQRHERHEQDRRQRRERQQAARRRRRSWRPAGRPGSRQLPSRRPCCDRVADRRLALEERRRLPDEMVVVALGPGQRGRRPGRRRQQRGRPTTTSATMRLRTRSDGRSGAGSSGDPVLRSDPPSTLVQEPFPVTGPASGGTERGTGAPSRSTGTQGAVGAILMVLALGLALRLIIAYLLPGSGFGVDLGVVPLLGGRPRRPRPARLLRARLLPRLHAGYLYVLWLRRDRRQGRRRRRRPDQDPADPRRPRPSAGSSGRWSASSAAASGWRSLGAARRGAQPDHLVRQRRLGPGRLVRRRVPAARRCASCGATSPSGRRSSRVIAALIKPQLGILIPIVAVVTIRRALWPTRRGPDARTGDRPDPARSRRGPDTPSGS